MTYVLGLTGSIGMGKSTTANMFRDQGVPVWDADAAVHNLYAPGAAGAKAIHTLAPAAIDAGGGVDRARLRNQIANDPTLLSRVNAAIHPLVAQSRARFLAEHPEPIVVLDIPLLFEVGGDVFCDGVLVVSAPAEAQAKRVMARGMSAKEFQMILSKQLPDAEKRSRADFIIETNDMDSARAQVRNLLSEIAGRSAHA